MEFKRILGNTWYAECSELIPVYLLNEHEVVLLDSGYADRDRADLIALLQSRDMKVRAVICSHIHNDHAGNLKYFQDTYGAEIYLHKWEASAVTSFVRLKGVYTCGMTGRLAELLPHLQLEADHVFSDRDDHLMICGQRFELISLPGHTQGHTGVVTPDRVCYVADTICSEHVLRKAKMPSVFNWAEDLESKAKLAETRYPAYILAHRGVYEDIQDLAAYNIADLEQRLHEMRALITEPCTMEDIQKRFWTYLGLHSTDEVAQMIYLRNAECMVEHMINTGMLQRSFADGVYTYTPV